MIIYDWLCCFPSLMRIYIFLILMKPCHICEKIVRTEKSIVCLACKKIFCFYCIHRFFPERADALLAKKEGELPILRITQCFACVSECKCIKCKNVENVVYQTAVPNSQPEGSIGGLVNDEELVPESGLFRGKKISDLPPYLQRIYLKKKVLYSKHEISCLTNDKNIPQQINAEDDKQNRIEEEKERKENDQFAIPEVQEQEDALKGDEAPSKNGQKNEEDEEEQAEDYESEFPSRRAAHLQSNNDNSGINQADVEDQEDPNPDNIENPDRESMIDENAEVPRASQPQENNADSSNQQQHQ